jgi:hypothetical protein
MKQELSIEQEDFLPLRVSSVRRRLLVVGLYCSFLLCLVALGIKSSFLSTSILILPKIVQIFVVQNTDILLLLPLSLLVICCIALYYSTQGIISGHTRYLDERQQLLRDKAHRTAYRIIILICVLVGSMLILHELFLSHTGAVPQVQMVTTHPWVLNSRISMIQSNPPLPLRIYTSPETFRSTQFSWSIIEPGNSSIGIWGYSMLLASLLLLISTLPRSVIAWGKQL